MSRLWPAWISYLLLLLVHCVLFVMAQPVLAQEPGAGTVMLSTDEDLAGISEAIETANAALSSISDYQIVLGGDSDPAQPHVVHTSFVKSNPFAGPQPEIQTFPGQTYIFIQPALLLQRVQELKVVRQEDVDRLGAAIAQADLSGGAFPKQWTEAGIKLMRQATFSDSDVLTALMLHEVGHLYCAHTLRGDTSSANGSDTNLTEAKRVEAEADRFAATALVSTLLGGSPEFREDARRTIDVLTMIGFRFAADRLRSGEAVMLDDSETHENMELRIVRIFDAVTAAVPWAGDFNEEIVGIIQDFDGMRALLAGDKPDPSMQPPCKIPVVKPPEGEKTTEATLLQPARAMLKEEKYGQAALLLADVIASRTPLWDAADPQRLRFYLYYANALYLNAQYSETKQVLTDALRIVDALGLRDDVRAVQVIGPLAVVDRYFLQNSEADALCEELRDRGVRSFNPPDDFLRQVEWTCGGRL